MAFSQSAFLSSTTRGPVSWLQASSSPASAEHSFSFSRYKTIIKIKKKSLGMGEEQHVLSVNHTPGALFIVSHFKPTTLLPAPLF